MTPAQLEDRLDRLERRLDPRPDRRRREAAIAELTRLVNGVVDSLAGASRRGAKSRTSGKPEAPETTALLALVTRTAEWKAAAATIKPGAEVRAPRRLPGARH